MLERLTQFAAGCDANGFFGFPKWYKYLPHESKVNPDTPLGSVTTCEVRADSIGDIGPILAAVIEILLRISAIVALVFVVYGGVKYITSEGEPENLKEALSTVINALIGLVIAVVATALVSFLASRFN